MSTIELHLGNPNLTLLHRAGLAGLWMTLKYFEDNPQESSPQGLSWELTPRQVILQWEGNDFEVLDSLLKESFQIHKGLISFRCIDSKDINDIQSRLIIHKGILGTFLQHNSTHKSAGVVTQSLQIDENSPVLEIKYKSLRQYTHQDFASKLCDKKGKFLTKPIKVAGWLNPGAVVRHVAFSSQTSFEETSERALILLFAPIACAYFLLKSKLQGNKSQFALVIPEVTNLEEYAKYRQRPSFKNAGYKSFYASSLGDAGLHFLVQKNTAKTVQNYGIKCCKVFTLGTVPWSTQQKTRTDIYTVKANHQVSEIYRLTCYYFADQILASKKGEGYFMSSFAKEFITDNLARGKPWYRGLSSAITSNELFEKLTYERGGLYQMVDKSLDTDAKKLFIRAFHDTLSHIYGEASGRGKDTGRKVNWDRINVQIRTKLMRCKNSSSLRSFICEFWSKTLNRSKLLQDNWEDLMILIETKNWKLLRDLALLGLASYKGKDKEENNNEFNQTDDNQEEEDEAIDI